MARFEIEFKKSVDKDVRGIPPSDLKKILLLTAVAALFTGCDSAGYEGPPKIGRAHV